MKGVVTAMQHDAHLVDVDAELQYWRNRWGKTAVAQQEFLQHAEPVIRVACDVYVRFFREPRQEWLRQLELRLELQQTSAERALALQLANQCWDRLCGE